MIFALLIALMLKKNRKGIRIYRAIFYLPSLFGSSVAVAVIWKKLFNKEGLLNQVLTVSEDSVSLQNAEFPLFTQEYSRANFEEKLRENPANDHLKVVVTERQQTEKPSEEQPDSLTLSIGFSEHPAFYDKKFNDRYTDLSFALGNKLLGVLDEKQNRERETANVGWYHKTDFYITATAYGEIFNYEGRFDIGDGEGDLIAHIKNFYDYALSPKGESLYRDEQEELRRGRDEFIPFLEKHTELTPEDEKLFAEIMATENEWFKPAEKTASKAEIVVRYSSGSEIIAIVQASNGKYFNHYGYDDKNGSSATIAGAFDTFEYAEKTLYSHRPKAEKLIELDNDGTTPQSEQSADDLIGREITVDNRRYVIESIGKISNDVPLRDITFQNNVGFPINRVEKLPLVREWLKAQEQEQLLPEKETAAIPSASAERHNYRITDDNLGVDGRKRQARNNIAAIRFLHDLESENRLATSEEQEILAKYVGWGGLSAAFDERNAAWSDEFTMLRNTLSPEEYRAAMESTLTAFYTPPIVIKAMYEALDNMGFHGGNILEPSCGTGNFFGLLPESMGKSKLHGVEIDSLTGRIAKQLYQKANIAIQGFEDTKLPDDHFDVVMGNVPFGDFKVSDSRYDKQKFLIHDYFFAKALDKVRAGGVGAFITPKGTMDKENPAVRRYIAQRAELLGAIRLPNIIQYGSYSYAK